jgi:hypothetical protein
MLFVFFEGARSSGALGGMAQAQPAFRFSLDLRSTARNTQVLAETNLPLDKKTATILVMKTATLLRPVPKAG